MAYTQLGPRATLVRFSLGSLQERLLRLRVLAQHEQRDTLYFQSQARFGVVFQDLVGQCKDADVIAGRDQLPQVGEMLFSLAPTELDSVFLGTSGAGHERSPQ